MSGASSQQKADGAAQGAANPEPQLPKATPAPQAQRAAPRSKAPKDDEGEDTDIFHVVGPGSIIMGTGEQRRVYRPGDLLELTVKEAESLGDAVALGEPPPPPEPAERRTIGRYRIGGPGGVIVGGKLYAPGEVVELSAVEARSLHQVRLERAK